MKAIFTKVFVLFITLHLFISVAAASKIEFKSVKTRGDRIQVSFNVVGYQRSDILEAIKRGIEVRLFFIIQIVKKSPMVILGERVIISKTILRSVKYDYWNKAFQVKEGKKTINFHSESHMLKYFFSLSNYELVSVDFLKGKKYSLRVKAELKSVDLYFPMNLIFKLIEGFWDFNTGWVKGPVLNY